MKIQRSLLILSHFCNLYCYALRNRSYLSLHCAFKSFWQIRLQFQQTNNNNNNFKIEIKPIHATAYFFAKIWQKNKTGAGIFLNIKQRQVHIVVFEGADFVFSNIFAFESANDFVYYILLVYDQFKLKPEIDPVYISGQVVKESEIYKLLYRYVRNIHMLQPLKGEKLENNLNNALAADFFEFVESGFLHVLIKIPHLLLLDR